MPKLNKGILTQEEKVRQKGNLVKAGYPEEIAEFYLDSPPGVQGILAREHKELVERGIRKPLVTVPPGVDQEQPTPSETPAPSAVTVPDASSSTGERAVVGPGQETPQEKAAAKAPMGVAPEEWPPLESPSNMTHAERVKWGNANEKENNKDLKETIAKKHALRESGTLIKGMTKINDGKYLPSGLGKLITIDPESGDIRETANLAEVANAQTQLYIKDLKRWQRGAKEFYGSRVTNFDLASFMQQLPTLLNSEQGRRLILKQMQYSNELEEVYNNTLNDALKHYGRNASFNQISDIVDARIKDKEADRI